MTAERGADRHWLSVVRSFMPNAMEEEKQSHSLKSAIGHHDVHGCFLSTLPDSGMIGRKWLKSMEFTLSDSPGSWEHGEGMGLEGVRLGWGYLKKFLHYT